MTFSHVNAMFINMTFNKVDRILITYFYLHCTGVAEFPRKTGTSQVFGGC